MLLDRINIKTEKATEAIDPLHVELLDRLVWFGDVVGMWFGVIWANSNTLQVQDTSSEITKWTRTVGHRGCISSGRSHDLLQPTYSCTTSSAPSIELRLLRRILQNALSFFLDQCSSDNMVDSYQCVTVKISIIKQWAFISALMDTEIIRIGLYSRLKDLISVWCQYSRWGSHFNILVLGTENFARSREAVAVILNPN